MPPFEYRPFHNPHAGSIGELLLRRGDIDAQRAATVGQAQAQAAQARGTAWGGAVGSVGDVLSRGLIAFQQERQQAPARARAEEAEQLDLDAKRRAAEEPARLSRQDSAFMALLELQPNPDPREVVRIYGPQRGMAIAQGMHAFTELQSGKVKDARETAGRLALGVKSASPALQAQFWPAIRAAAVKGGLGAAEDIPEQPTAEYLDAVLAWATGQGPSQPDLIQRDPTKDLVHPTTGAVVTPGTPEEKTHKVTVPGPNGPIEKLVTEDELRRGVPGYRAPTQPAQPSYQAKEVLNDAGQPVMANYDARTGVVTDIATGQPIKNPRPVPSALETQDARKFKQAEPILRSVSELSERINTQQGAIAKIAGGVEKAKAQANYNDDVAEYEALISGFTPLVARALGHTGVLTQQDVDSVKALFPKPGDSKSLRDRKIARIKSIIGELESDASPGAAGADAGRGAGRVYYDAEGNPVTR